MEVSGFFEREDPGLRDVIAYVVARALGRESTLTRTKLVKMLYLVDVGRHASGRRSLTDLPWIFFHHGPYAMPLADELERMEGHEISVRRLHGDRGEREVMLYVGAPEAPDADRWPAPTKALVDRVIDRWAPAELNELLDFVYFHTAPMENAVRGEPLDMSSARGQRDVRERPLPPPPRPDDADDRLREWLERRRAGRASRADVDPPARYDADYWRLLRATSGYADGDPQGTEATGHLHVALDDRGT
jgi:hypothetical protein